MCIEKSALQRVLEEIGKWPVWYDVEGVERVCDVITEAVIEGLALPDAVKVTLNASVSWAQIVWPKIDLDRQHRSRRRGGSSRPMFTLTLWRGYATIAGSAWLGRLLRHDSCAGPVSTIPCSTGLEARQ